MHRSHQDPLIPFYLSVFLISCHSLSLLDVALVDPFTSFPLFSLLFHFFFWEEGSLAVLKAYSWFWGNAWWAQGSHEMQRMEPELVTCKPSTPLAVLLFQFFLSHSFQNEHRLTWSCVGVVVTSCCWAAHGCVSAGNPSTRDCLMSGYSLSWAWCPRFR